MDRNNIKLTANLVYRNRNGSDYICKTVYEYDEALMERIPDRWTLIAHGIQQYEDGTIEWDYSKGGHWPR